MSPDNHNNTIKQKAKKSQGVIQVAGNYIRGIPVWVLFIGSILLVSAIIYSVYCIVKYLDRDSSIEIIDVSLIDTDTNKFPIVEFRLRNIGGKVAYIKTAQFEILDYKPIYFCADPAKQSVTEKYDVKLLTEGSPPYIQSKKVDQYIPANQTDRFQFKILSSDPGVVNYYLLKINLIFNTGDDHKVSSQPLIIEVPQDKEILGSTLIPGKKRFLKYIKCMENNKDNILYILKMSNKKRGEINELHLNNLEEYLKEVNKALDEGRNALQD